MDVTLKAELPEIPAAVPVSPSVSPAAAPAAPAAPAAVGILGGLFQDGRALVRAVVAAEVLGPPAALRENDHWIRQRSEP